MPGNVAIQKTDQFCDQAKDYFRRVLKRDARKARIIFVMCSVPLYIVHMTKYGNLIILMFSNSKFRWIQTF
jgi:hypothetical protein